MKIHETKSVNEFFKSWQMSSDQDTFLIELNQKYKMFKLTENILLNNNTCPGYNDIVKKVTLENRAVAALVEFKNNFNKKDYTDFNEIGLTPTYKEIDVDIPEHMSIYEKSKIVTKTISDLVSSLYNESKYPEVFEALYGNEYSPKYERIIFTDPYIKRLLEIVHFRFSTRSCRDIRLSKKIFVSFNAYTESPSMLQFGHIPFKEQIGKPFEFSVIQTLPVLGVINVEGI
jgi:hypothetical protein